ncbi:MAG: pitrilysin family protein [Armatimonadota bacterium]|nr:insulinase family protein [Armatimonadota bacterium]MDW8155923.1 pitrilysin family protein [Armatimonadota bacterium]
MIRGTVLVACALLLAASATSAGGLQPLLLEEVLPNGLRVVVAPQPASPAVTVDVWVQVGSRDETDELNGAAHFVEHMLFKGTRRRPVGQAAREVEGLGGRINASTGYDYTHYYAVAPAGAWERVLEVQADVLTDPLFDPQEVEREREVVLQELSLIYDTPSRYAFFKLFGTAFTVHPYRRPVGGSPEAVRRMSRAQLVEFYRSHYGPARATVVVAGGMPARPVLERARALFGRWRREVRRRERAPREPVWEGVRRAVEVRDVQVTTVAVGWLGPGVDDPDHYAVDVLVYALGQGRSGRWVRELRDRRRVVQAVSVGYPTLKDPSLVYVVATTTDADETRAESAVLEEVRRLRREGVTEEELERAKVLLESDVRREQHTSRGLAASLGFAATVADLDYHRTYLDNVRRVTREEVLEVARRYLDPDRYAVVAIRPRRSP